MTRYLDLRPWWRRHIVKLATIALVAGALIGVAVAAFAATPLDPPPHATLIDMVNAPCPKPVLGYFYDTNKDPHDGAELLLVTVGDEPVALLTYGDGMDGKLVSAIIHEGATYKTLTPEQVNERFPTPCSFATLAGERT